MELATITMTLPQVFSNVAGNLVVVKVDYINYFIIWFGGAVSFSVGY